MNFKNWVGQATTGAGFATVLAGLGALGTGALSWQQAIPVVVGGVAGLIWPENAAASSTAQQAAAEVSNLIAAYRTIGSSPAQAAGPGLQHVPPAPSASAAG